MLGEELSEAKLGEEGIPADRSWGARDELRGDFFVAKRVAALMSCAAWYEGDDPIPRIRLPDGQSFPADADGAALRLGAAIGREVSLWPVVPEARQAEPQDGRNLADEMRDLLAREEHEPLPDFSNPPRELLEIYARNGPFFDAYPLLLLTRRSIESLAAAEPELRLDPRRFRPSLLIEGANAGAFPEQQWIGRRLRVGKAIVKVQSTCIRCAMTTHGFADLPKQPRVMRTLVRESDGNLGVYATVETPGEVRAGDSITLLD
jgi:uncharacterized protein YcbX